MTGTQTSVKPGKMLPPATAEMVKGFHQTHKILSPFHLLQEADFAWFYIWA
jgi:hypothetical protein